jgi:hypothetical protein
MLFRKVVSHLHKGNCLIMLKSFITGNIFTIAKISKRGIEYVKPSIYGRFYGNIFYCNHDFEYKINNMGKKPKIMIY